MWGQGYMAGDKYARKKAVEGIRTRPAGGARGALKALAPLSDTMPKADFEALLADLFPNGKL